MKKILIIVGDPDSINIEIISKAFNILNKKIKKKITLIGNYELIKKKFKSKIKIKINKINFLKDSSSNNLNILNVNLDKFNKKEFDNLKVRKYIIKSFEIAHSLAIKNSSIGIINCPIDKRIVFNAKKIGITEYLAKKK